MFDVNFNLTRTEQFMQMLNEGGYVDELTSELKVSIPLLSLEFGKPTLVTIVFKPLPAGGWKMNYDVITMDFNLVYPDGYFGLTSGDKELRERDMIRCVIEVLFMVSFVYLMLEELAQLRQEIKERGHPFGYFVDFGNVLDLLNFIFQWLALYTYWQIYQQIQTIEMSPDLHYSIYADDFAVGRLTQVNRCDAIFMPSIRVLIPSTQVTHVTLPLPAPPALTAIFMPSIRVLIPVGPNPSPPSE